MINWRIIYGPDCGSIGYMVEFSKQTIFGQRWKRLSHYHLGCRFTAMFANKEEAEIAIENEKRYDQEYVKGIQVIKEL